VARGREASETRRATSSRASRGAVTALWLECSGCVVTGRVWEYSRGYYSPGSWTRRAGETAGAGASGRLPPRSPLARLAVPLLSPRSPPPHLGRAPAMLSRSLRPLAAAPRAAAPRALSSSVAKSALQAQQASSRAALRVALDAARCTAVSPAGARRFVSSEPSSDGSVDVSPSPASLLARRCSRGDAPRCRRPRRSGPARTPSRATALARGAIARAHRPGARPRRAATRRTFSPARTAFAPTHSTRPALQPCILADSVSPRSCR